jgi:TPR repeat protein
VIPELQRLVIECNDMDAAMLLARLYRKGVGVAKDLSESVCYLAIASWWIGRSHELIG